MSETFEYENLFAGSAKNRVPLDATARVFESFSRGQIIGRLTATGKWQVIDIADKANCDDFAIAAEAVDTTDGTERKFVAYVEGDFNENGVLYSYNDTADDWRQTLANHGIYLRKAVSTAGV